MRIREGTIAAPRLPRLASALLAASLLGLCALYLAPSGSAAVATCPSFRVLHNDRIGAASFPAGSYAITPATGAGISCSAASQLFARFLEDYDGVLPRPWRVVAKGSGKADFVKGGATGFSVALGSSGGGGNTPLGALCKSPFTVNAGKQLGPLSFPRGQYLLYQPPRTGISCRRAGILFTRFLGAPGTRLPSPWKVNAQTATFFKPANPTRSAFRVEPIGGAGPR